ncbi:CLUMA_CG006751, isoform A [Clunio marinus]|uniref:CLUMA_CG006751, isoform A n=1 Tax=Clunio marinus TaxID=568069 RepID=A0A1J1HYN2_9DIPT|nr:CLUMA_CG006751, isoform A [Clunio marinus]
MSARKVQSSLNLSGFSPIQLNTRSPVSVKSPGKDYGINERIEKGREKLIADFDRWKLAESSSNLTINSIHNLKEKSRQSASDPYPPELENFCQKLKTISTVFKNVIDNAISFRNEMKRSICILESMNDNDELMTKLKAVQEFLDSLIRVYEHIFSSRKFVVENIAHATSMKDSNLLIAAWTFNSKNQELLKMITQLKISPEDYQWKIR